LARQTIQELRNAELKGLTSRTAADVHVEINDTAMGHPERKPGGQQHGHDLDWRFADTDGAFDSQPVLQTLHDYLQDVSGVVDEAEGRLTP
jgi:hypothetical protein